ncbi:cylicin-2-like [Haliotis asinina]|uniref:cylicin-2-like n=1 Tax=Haliotis asinina TaxID=109174 RepID=UPI003531F6C6
MASEIYECSKCDTNGKREQLIEHFIRTHVSLERAPWTCSLCDFKAVSVGQLHRHTHHFRHQEALRQKPREKVEYEKSPNPYEVQIGRDIFPYREDEPVYRYGMENVFDYEHKSAGTCDGSYMNTGTAHEQTESDKAKEGERNIKERTRFSEGWGSTSERRMTVDKQEGNSTERKMKSDKRKEKGGERKKKSEDREVNGVERNSKSRREGRSGERKMISNEREGKGGGRNTKSEDREGKGGGRKRRSEDSEGKGGGRKRRSEDSEGKGGGRKRRSEDREGKSGGRKRRSEDREGNDRERNMLEGRDGSMIERRNISGNGELRVEKWRQNYRTPEPDKLKKNPTSSRSVDTNTLTKLDPAVTGETSRKKNFEEYGGTGNTQIHNEAQKATSSTVRTEEPGMSFSSEQRYNFGTEPEESAEVKVESDSDIEGQSSRGGTEGMTGVSSQCQEGALVGKINELMQCLEPLKNISKALIALDHHMRRLLPLVNQIHIGTPSSTEGL